eukprot:3620283-Prymnesium_polylepis.2
MGPRHGCKSVQAACGGRIYATHLAECPVGAGRVQLAAQVDSSPACASSQAAQRLRRGGVHPPILWLDR